MRPAKVEPMLLLLKPHRDTNVGRDAKALQLEKKAGLGQNERKYQ